MITARATPSSAAAAAAGPMGVSGGFKTVMYLAGRAGGRAGVGMGEAEVF